MRSRGFLRRVWVMRFPRGARNRVDDNKVRHLETSRGRALRASDKEAPTRIEAKWTGILIATPFVLALGYMALQTPWLAIPTVLAIALVLWRNRRRPRTWRRRGDRDRDQPSN